MPTINFSAGGMRVIAEEPIALGALLEMQLQLVNLREPLTMRGQVIWSKMKTPGVFEVGVQFLDHTPGQQVQLDGLVEFLHKNAPGPS